MLKISTFQNLKHDDLITFSCLYVKVIWKDTPEVKINCKIIFPQKYWYYTKKKIFL
jgi:hypothetical protein